MCYYQGEVKEMIELYEEKGFTKEEATDIMNILKKNKDYFVNHMMVQVRQWPRGYLPLPHQPDMLYL